MGNEKSKTRKAIKLFLLLISSIFILLFPTKIVQAASFDELNQSSIFVKQQKNDTCTLASAVMMVRRAALGSGNSNWASITESSMRGTAWKEGSGLYFSFKYAGISVSHAKLSGGAANTNQLISLLSAHPEGIVIYDQNKPHAILLTDYTNGTFYCADPASSRPSGRIPISSAMITIANADAYWYVTSPKISIGGNLIKLWGISENDEFTGTAKLWAKRFNDDSNHYAVFYLDGQPITGNMSADASGFFSVEVDTSKYPNGDHTFRIEYAYTYGGDSDQRTIRFKNDTNVELWGINDNDTFSGMAQLWAKRYDNDPNHYAIFYLDDQAVTGHVSADASGYFNFYLNTNNYSNGSHRLKIYYANTSGGDTSERTIRISNSVFLNITKDSVLGGTSKVQLKVYDYDKPVSIYVDDSLIQTVNKGSDNVCTVWIDTTKFSQGSHNLRAIVNTSSGEKEIASCQVVFSQDYILAIDNPSKDANVNKGDILTISGWLNDNAQGDFYIDGNLIKTITKEDLFFRPDIEYTGGYSFTYNTESLKQGKHELTLKSTTNKRIASQTTTFYIIGGSESDEENTSESGTPSKEKDSSASTQADNTSVYVTQGENSEQIDSTLKRTTLKKIKANKNSIAITWKKVKDKGIKGYEIQSSTDKNFKNNVKSVVIKNTKTTSKTIKKLKSGKKYYVRIRTYKKVGVNKTYSNWSKTKNIKVK
jgi:hypothetical protein